MAVLRKRNSRKARPSLPTIPEGRSLSSDLLSKSQGYGCPGGPEQTLGNAFSRKSFKSGLAALGDRSNDAGLSGMTDSSNQGYQGFLSEQPSCDDDFILF